MSEASRRAARSAVVAVLAWLATAFILWAAACVTCFCVSMVVDGCRELWNSAFITAMFTQPIAVFVALVLGTVIISEARSTRALAALVLILADLVLVACGIVIAYWIAGLARHFAWG